MEIWAYDGVTAYWDQGDTFVTMVQSQGFELTVDIVQSCQEEFLSLTNVSFVRIHSASRYARSMPDKDEAANS